jgi:hypothetical protein
MGDVEQSAISIEISSMRSSSSAAGDDKKAKTGGPGGQKAQEKTRARNHRRLLRTFAFLFRGYDREMLSRLPHAGAAVDTTSEDVLLGSVPGGEERAHTCLAPRPTEADALGCSGDTRPPTMAMGTLSRLLHPASVTGRATTKERVTCQL